MTQQSNGLRARDDESRVQKFFGYVNEDGVFTPDEGRTKQEFAKDADINSIVANITKTGTSQWLENHEAWVKSAGDVEVPNIDYKTLMDQLADAESRFMELPSGVRKGFDNDTAQFIEFVQSEGGNVELAELLAKANPAVVKKGSLAEGSKDSAPAAPAARQEPSGEGDPPG